MKGMNMTVPRWNAQEFDQRMRAPRTRKAGNPQRVKTVVGIALVGILLGGAATAGSQVFDGPDPIGVCHATGSQENPYVFLVVDEKGYEHGHHRHHEDDFFRDATAGHCGDDVPGVPGNTTDAPEAGDGNSTDDAPEAGADDGLEDGPDGDNATDGPANETTGDEGADAEGNSTEPTNGTSEQAPAEEEEPLLGDIDVDHWADQDEHQATLTIVLENVGEGNATDVSLADALPDVRRPWALSGTDAAACTLDGNDLACWFGTLEPGVTREIQVQAYLDRMPCGESMTSTATGSAEDDPEPRNDASSASIEARYC